MKNTKKILNFNLTIILGITIFAFVLLSGLQQKVKAATLLPSDLQVSSHGSNVARNTGVAYNVTRGEYVSVWFHSASGQIFGQRISPAGNKIGGQFQISTLTDGAEEPKVVWNSQDDEFLVVFSGYINSGSEGAIFAQRLGYDLGGNIIEVGTNDKRISDTPAESNGFDIILKVAYNSTDNQYLVAWLSDASDFSHLDLHTQLLEADLTEIGTNDQKIDSQTTNFLTSMNVAYNSTDNEYLVVWEDPGSGTNRVIHGQFINNTGSETGSNDFPISASGLYYDATVTWNSDRNEYLVVFSKNVAASSNDIFGQLLGSNGAFIGTEFRISHSAAGGNTADDPQLSYNSTDGEYLVYWTGDHNIEGTVADEIEIFAQRLNFDGAEIDSDFRVSHQGPDTNTGIYARWPWGAYDPVNNRFLIAWEGGDSSYREIYAQLYDLSPDTFDFGDAPDPTYPTLLANNGARHIPDGSTYLGACVDSESNGQQTVNADGDNNNTGLETSGTCAISGDDEDGVSFTSPLTAQEGQIVSLDITASSTGALSAWLDFNGDGDWDDAFERIFSDRNLTAGTNSLTFVTPDGARGVDTYARFRFTSTSGMVTAPTGEASDGEVEDYKVTIEACSSMICNDSFEEGFKFWKNINGQITTNSHTGTNAVQSTQLLTSGDQTKWIGVEQRGGVLSGQEYKVNAWFKSTNAVNGHIKVMWLDDTETLISIQYPFGLINGTNTEWFERSGTVRAPFNAVEAKVFVLHGVSGGTNQTGSELIIDDVTFADTCELFCNGSFEQGYRYWDTSGSTQIETSGVQDGSYVSMTEQVLTSAEPAKWVQVDQKTEVVPGNTYTLNVWFRHENLARGHTKIQWLNSTGGIISTKYMFGVLSGTNSTWLNWNGTANSPVGAAEARIRFLHGVNSSGENVLGSKLWIDDVKFTTIDEALCNGGFEQGLTCWSTRPGQTLETSSAYVGTAAAKSEQIFTSSEALQWAGLEQEINVLGNTRYNLTFWLKTQNAVNGHAKVIWKDSGGNEISTDYLKVGIWGTNSTWALHEGTAFSPANAATGTIKFLHGVIAGVNQQGGMLWVDGVEWYR